MQEKWLPSDSMWSGSPFRVVARAMMGRATESAEHKANRNFFFASLEDTNKINLTNVRSYEYMLGDEDGPKAKAPAGSRSSTATRRLRPGSLVGRRPGHTMSELRLRTSLSGKEWRCLVCSSSAWARQWGMKREWRVSCPRALASGMGGSGGGWGGLA
ncbi:hypothetical protein EYF80_003279 [Liparis tanakae]|uniref:Uncharacterized protein n=1 Tax=Liparis tanakae TaxID=230148 RepID=A0A4Z2J8K8_9TELE|nr:hypothetical protein EYF80_003279 [Liparis tanakae]